MEVLGTTANMSKKVIRAPKRDFQVFTPQFTIILSDPRQLIAAGFANVIYAGKKHARV